MRIILDLQACQASSMHRGIGRYSMALALAMARNSRSHDLRIVLNEDYPDSVMSIRKAFDNLLPPSQISTFATPVPTGEVDYRNGWRVRASERIREHYLASLRPDIVHVASLFEGLSDNVISSVPPIAPLGMPRYDTAVTLYDLIPLMRKERYLADPNVAAWYHRKLDGLKRADLLLAISQSARTEALDLLQLNPDDVVNISSAVDAMFHPRALDHDQRTRLLQRHGLKRDFIMYTGGIDYRKNIEGLVEAYSMLPVALRQRYQLAIVCGVPDPDRLRLQRLAARLDLASDDLVLTGFVPDDDLIGLYNCTSLFVFPSLHEGFGLPALEAMACGAPVIGSNTSSIPEVIGRADALFDPTSNEAISASMAAVLNDPAYQAELRAHGMKQAARFSWDVCAKRAIDAFEESARRARAHGTATLPAGEAARKPRMAFVSPLPPQRSGIADYSADLLPALAQHYDIDLVIAQDAVDTSKGLDRFAQRSATWFDDHAHAFDRIVYQFGNSAFHSHMFGLLDRHPGIVVLHDFYLSGVTSHAEADHCLPNHYCRALYLAHGYGSLIYEKAQGRAASVLTYPCNKSVLDRATGVIVHSKHARELASHWYGAGAGDDWKVLPLLRDLPTAIDREGARRMLGFGDEDFVICSFGILSATKCNERIVDAWIASELATNPHCHLVFVGELAAGRFGATLRERIATHPRIKITGYTDQATYRAYLAAADGAAQLRRDSRGETSGSVLDCLSYGIPTIVNAYGTNAELPAATCLFLDADFSDASLGAALSQLHQDAALRTRLRDQGLAHARLHHSAEHAASCYRDAIEKFDQQSSKREEQRLIKALGAMEAAPKPDLVQTAAAIASNRGRVGPSQLLIDVTSVHAGAACEGLAHLLATPAAGWRIEPVRYDGTRYLYARRFTLDLIGRADLQIEDAVVETTSGDVLVALDGGSPPTAVPKWRARGVLDRLPPGAPEVLAQALASLHALHSGASAAP